MNNVLRKLASNANFGTLQNDKVVYDARLNAFASSLILDTIECLKNHAPDQGNGLLSVGTIEKILKDRFGV